jgi:integrase
VVAHLSAFLTWCTKRDPAIVPENVAKRIDRQEVLVPEHKRERYLTREEWAAVMHELDEWPYRATRGSRFSATTTVRLERPQLRQLVSCEALRVLLLTGSRKGETLAMRWTDVDLDAGWWIKPRETTKGGKTHEIALQPQGVDSLRRLQAAHGDPVFAFPGKARLDAIISGHKLRHEEGGHIRDIHEAWGRIRTKLGMLDVHIHDLRHTTASVLISAGADLYSVGQQLGHSQAQTTQRYAHLFEERKRALADMIEAFAAGNPSKPSRARTTRASRSGSPS